MITKNIISNVFLHARPAGILAKEMKNYKCEVKIKFKDLEYNAKNLLALMSSCIKIGDGIEIICDGEDELEAMSVIEKILLDEKD